MPTKTKKSFNQEKEIVLLERNLKELVEDILVCLDQFQQIECQKIIQMSQ